MVTSGTVYVTVSSGGGSTQLPAPISVTNRSGFAFSSPSATLEGIPFTCPGNGPTLSISSPPSSTQTPTGETTGQLGAFCDLVQYTFNAAAVSGGPNDGYKYVTSVTPTSTGGVNTAYYYVVSSDLQNSSSAFSQAQCGNYNAQTKPSGYISQPNLLANTVRHESGAAQSHYAQYVAAMSNSSNNVGVVAEQQVGSPGTANQTFIDNVTATLNSKVQAILSATGVEPCGCNYDASCGFQGYTNFPPYAPCN